MADLCLPLPSRVFRSNWGSGVAVAPDVSAGQLFEAVEIGPQSEASDCYLFLQGKQPPSPNADGAATVFNSRNPLADAIHLRVGEPYVGPVIGPILMAPRYFDSSFSGVNQGVQGIDAYAAYAAGMPEPIKSGLHTLELIFWPRAPHWFRRTRPDAVYSAVYDAAGTIGETLVMRCPAYGREDFLFSYRMPNITGGTATIRIYGRKYVNESAGTGVATTLSTIALTASGEANYEYEGKFDYYDITVQAAATTGATLLKMGATLRDKR